MQDSVKPDGITPSQTVGPFFKFGVEFEGMNEVAFPHSPGAIMLDGRVYDGARAVVIFFNARLRDG